jgi:hypothetical protein
VACFGRCWSQMLGVVRDGAALACRRYLASFRAGLRERRCRLCFAVDLAAGFSLPHSQLSRLDSRAVVTAIFERNSPSRLICFYRHPCLATAIRRTECIAVRSSHARLRSSYAPLILRSAWPAFAPPARSVEDSLTRSDRNGSARRLAMHAISIRLTSLPRSSATLPCHRRVSIDGIHDRRVCDALVAREPARRLAPSVPT